MELNSENSSLSGDLTNIQEKLDLTRDKSKLFKVIIFSLIFVIFLEIVGFGYLKFWKNTEKNYDYTKPSVRVHNNGSDKVTGSTSESKYIGADNIIEANNQFALNYYFKLSSKDKDKNIFFSPFSISSAMAMAYEGAKGQTAEEIRKVFYFPNDDELRRTEYKDLFDNLNKKDKKYQMSVANALWAQKDYKFLDDYLDRVEKYYGGKASNLDFVKDTEKSRKTINSWVENKTNEKIKDIIPPGLISDLTRLVITNAIYFKGDWAKQFDEKVTRDEDFRVNKNNTKKVSMMRELSGEFNYTENEILQILEMDYLGKDLSMLVLLPKNDDLENLENLINNEKILEWKKGLENQKVRVYIPKFKFETKYFMADDLKEMGMLLPFNKQRPGADFSGMDGTDKLVIEQVIHQAFVEINEGGTEAMATAVIMSEQLAGPGDIHPEAPIFRADHPFIFLIQEKVSGNVLFIGKMVDPSL